MSTSPKIYGVIPILQMPYRDDDSIDYEVLAKEIDFVFHAGSDGVGLALASELIRLTKEERIGLTEQLPQMVGERGTVTISIGAESAGEAAAFAESAEKAGADAVMAIPPLGTVLPETKIYEYYETIVQAVSIPLVVQDASGYMGYPLSVDLQVRMRREFGPAVYFKPEAPPVGPTLTRLQQALNNDGVIFEGSGGTFLIDAFRRGITGTMPGSDCIKAIVTIWKALQRGNDDRAYEVYFPLTALINLQMGSLDTFLAVEKYLLVKQGVFTNQRIRQPSAYSLDEETKSEVDRIFDRLEKVLASD